MAIQIMMDVMKNYTPMARAHSQSGIKMVQVFDSGDQVDRITASIHGVAFNNNEMKTKVIRAQMQKVQSLKR